MVEQKLNAQHVNSYSLNEVRVFNYLIHLDVSENPTVVWIWENKIGLRWNLLKYVYLLRQEMYRFIVIQAHSSKYLHNYLKAKTVVTSKIYIIL